MSNNVLFKRAYQQSPEAAQNWLQGEYPAIEQRARAEGAEIHWGDETALVNTDVRGGATHRLARHLWRWLLAAVSPRANLAVRWRFERGTA